MKSIKLSVLLILTGFLAACAPETNSLTPEPDELVSDKRYENQLHRIDKEREEKGQESFSKLLEQDRVTKTYNGTEPVIVEIVETKSMDEAKLDAEQRTGGVAHDRIRVEEYFIIPSGHTSSEVENIDVDIDTDIDAGTQSEDEIDQSRDTININISPQNIIDEQTSDGEEDHLNENSKPEFLQEIIQPIPPSKGENINLEMNNRDYEEKEVLKIEEQIEEREIEKEELGFNPDTAVAESLRPRRRPEFKNYTAWWDKISHGSTYTKYTLNALENHGDKLLKATNIDDADFCPNLNRLSRDNKKRFWLTVISAMARWESEFNTDASFREPTSGFLSRGLLQLDYRHRGVYNCNLRNTEDLYNPQKNLECGVKMITHLVTRDRTIARFDGWKGRISQWSGIPAFWAVLRFETSSRRKLQERLTIKNEARKLSFCR